MVNLKNRKLSTEIDYIYIYMNLKNRTLSSEMESYQKYGIKKNTYFKFISNSFLSISAFAYFCYVIKTQNIFKTH